MCQGMERDASRSMVLLFVLQWPQSRLFSAPNAKENETHLPQHPLTALLSRSQVFVVDRLSSQWKPDGAGPSGEPYPLTPLRALRLAPAWRVKAPVPADLQANKAQPGTIKTGPSDCTEKRLYRSGMAGGRGT